MEQTLESIFLSWLNIMAFIWACLHRGLIFCLFNSSNVLFVSVFRWSFLLILDRHLSDARTVDESRFLLLITWVFTCSHIRSFNIKTLHDFKKWRIYLNTHNTLKHTCESLCHSGTTCLTAARARHNSELTREQATEGHDYSSRHYRMWWQNGSNKIYKVLVLLWNRFSVSWRPWVLWIAVDRFMVRRTRPHAFSSRTQTLTRS